MATVTLYKPNEQAQQYKGASSVSVSPESGVLTFYWKKDSMSYEGTKFITTVPFLVEEDNVGM
jgi:hypothetical protein